MPKSGKILLDPVSSRHIYPGSSKISSNLKRFLLNRTKNLLDLMNFCWIWCIFAGSNYIGCQNPPYLARKVTRKLEKSLKLMYFVRWVSRVLEEETRNRSVGVGFIKVRPHIQLPEQSDRVVTGRVRLGLVDWLGGVDTGQP